MSALLVAVRRQIVRIQARMSARSAEAMRRSIRAEIEREAIRSLLPVALTPRPRAAGQILAVATHVRTVENEFAEASL